MGIVLSLKTDPVTVPGPGVYAGASFTFRRLRTAQMDAARGRVTQVLRDARQGLEALAPYGLDGEDASGARINPLNPIHIAGAHSIVAAVEICLEALESWTGVVSQPGGPLAPIDRETLSMLLQDPALCRWLLDQIDKANQILVTEGNGSAGSLGGSSAIRPGIEAGQTIAAAAPPPAKPARAAKGRARDAGAPKPSTRRTPPKPAPSGVSSSAPAPGSATD